MKTKLREVLKETWNIYSKNIPGFMGLFVLPVVLGLAMKMGLFGFLGLNAVANRENIQNLNIGLLLGGFVLVIILGWLIQLLGLNTTLRGAFLTDSTGKLSFAQAFREGLQKLGKAAGLSIRVFFYTGAWLLGALAVLFALGTLGAIMTANGLSSNGGENGFLKIIAPLMSFMAFLPLVMIVLLLFLIGRICKSTFAFPILLSKEISSKDALHESISLADGLTGTIFSNYFLFGLLIAIVSVVLSQIFMQLIGLVMPVPKGSIQESVNYIQNITEYAGLIPGIVVGSFSVVFNYAFMKKVREEKADQGGAGAQTIVQNTGDTVVPTPPTGPILAD